MGLRHPAQVGRKVGFCTTEDMHLDLSWRGQQAGEQSSSILSDGDAVISNSLQSMGVPSWENEAPSNGTGWGGRVGSLDGFGLIQLSRCLAMKQPCASFRSSTIIMGVKLIICLIETAFFQRTQKPVGIHCLTQPFNLPARQ